MEWSIIWWWKWQLTCTCMVVSFLLKYFTCSSSGYKCVCMIFSVHYPKRFRWLIKLDTNKLGSPTPGNTYCYVHVPYYMYVVMYALRRCSGQSIGSQLLGTIGILFGRIGLQPAFLYPNWDSMAESVIVSFPSWGLLVSPLGEWGFNRENNISQSG